MGPPSAAKKEKEHNAKLGVNRKEKNLYWYTRLGKIAIEEQIFTAGRWPEIRPFCQGAEVECRGYSGGLQRALTDFGADEAFARAAAKLKEHYGIAVPVSAVRGFTEEQGATMLAQEKRKSAWPDCPGVPVLIVEMDGSMLPWWKWPSQGQGEAPRDRRKTRQVSWREGRLALAQEPGSVTPIFGATPGSVEEAGERLAVCAVEAGAGNQTKFHGVGDRASWISEQMEVQFGTQAQYVIDFYHLCDYLSAAGEVIAGNDKAEWRKEKKDQLKDNRWKEVFQALQPFLEQAQIPDSEAPVRTCFRYLEIPGHCDSHSEVIVIGDSEVNVIGVLGIVILKSGVNHDSLC